MRRTLLARAAPLLAWPVGTALEGRVIAVAGGAGNLGPTVVRQLADAGRVRVSADATRSGLDALASEIGAPIETDVVDLLDPVATKAWAADLAARHDGRVDGLVHLVGGWRGGTPIEEAPLEDWDFLERAPRTYRAERDAGIRVLADGERGTAGSSSCRPGQAQAPTHRTPRTPPRRPPRRRGRSRSPTASRERGEANIVVVGAIVTPAMRAESPDKDFSTFTPAEEIAEAIAYLCSDAASSMNGQRVTLRGAV